MKQAPYRGPLNKLIHCWMEWCVDHSMKPTFQKWMGFGHDENTRRLLMDEYEDHKRQGEKR